uniref:rho family-interacting cell polarization regulator 1-like n=1 Tax=Oncorhynchus gorbuscha TaxID=8017 RepID=UPI001EAEEB8B|nr:rho family-interacting cell polarization regulator 1-like [Oncorhynchus gorbuscha]
MAGAMSVAIFLPFVLVAVTLGSTGAPNLSSLKDTNKTTPTLYVITTVVPASKASITSLIVSETPDSAPTGNTEVPLESSPTTEPSQSSQTLTPSQASDGSTTSTGFTADTSTNETLTGTTSHDSTSSNFSSTLSPNSDFTTGNISSSTALQSDGSHDLSRSPGLVAVLCIFCICLGLLLAVGIAKFINSRGSKFERLEDVPMGKMNEESPFARYPTKQF